jgi:hypothetical protein
MPEEEKVNEGSRRLYSVKFIERIMCVERHQRTKVDFLDKDTPACEWGQKRKKATTCGECAFGVKIAEPTAKYDFNEGIKEITANKGVCPMKNEKENESTEIMFA